MSEEPLASNEEIQTATLTPDQNDLFMEAYDCAKNNYNWHKVSSAISNNPKWLTRIPQGRRWTMLHQIVFFGNVPHLNEILANEISNDEFRFLCKTLDDKTVREVAAERAHINPQMLRRVERLVASDQLLNNARDGKWELVRTFLRQQPDIINEKPPYRKLYLAHYLASMGQLDMFKDLSTICQFKLDLLANNKTISQTARDNNHIEFAEFVETLPPDVYGTAETINENAATASSADTSSHATSTHSYSQGFYDDPGIMIFSLNPNVLGNMFLSQDGSSSYPNHHHHSPEESHYATNHSPHGQNPTTVPITTADSHQTSANGHDNKKKSETHVLSSVTEEEQAKYEKTVMENIEKLSAENLLNDVTCCITKSILRDPVLAADGYTYEREAILNWFTHSNRSPMTNQELENLDLISNHAIKSILQTLSVKKPEEKKVDEKSKINGDNAN